MNPYKVGDFVSLRVYNSVFGETTGVLPPIGRIAWIAHRDVAVTFPGRPEPTQVIDYQLIDYSWLAPLAPLEELATAAEWED